MNSSDSYDITDCSGELIFATLYNTPMSKDNMTILDNIVIDDSNKIIDITLKPREITYNDFRLINYPTTTGHFQMNKINNTYLNFDQWEIETDDGISKFIFYDFIFSAIEQKIGINKNSFNPALKLTIEKQAVKMNNFTDFITHGSVYALTWHEITTLLEQIGLIYNVDENKNEKPICLTMVLNYKPLFVQDLTIRIYCPFIVTGIYKNWTPLSIA